MGGGKSIFARFHVFAETKLTRFFRDRSTGYQKKKFNFL